MKRILEKAITLFFTAVFVVILSVGALKIKKAPLVIANDSGSNDPNNSNGNNLDSTSSSSSLEASVINSAIGLVSSQGTSQPKQTFVGDSQNTPWGKVSAAIVVENGKIISISTPDIPNSPPSQYAQPTLIQEALQSGSANIQGVSGATYTSQAFKLSLESAIAKAKNVASKLVNSSSASTSNSKTSVVVPTTNKNNSTSSSPTNTSLSLLSNSQIVNLASSTSSTTNALITTASSNNSQTSSNTTQIASSQTSSSNSNSNNQGQALTFIGSTYSLPWGNLSVAIIVQNGRIISINTPTYPDSPPSQYAQPTLIQEALQSGSANIQGVSGATYTSQAFKLSLESAIALASNYLTNSTTLSSNTTSNNSNTSASTSQNSTTSSSNNSSSSSNTISAGSTPIVVNIPITPSSSTLSSSNSTSSGSTSSTSTASSGGTTTTSSSSSTGSQSQPQTFTGTTYSVPWGNVTVSIVVQNGQITGVSTPNIPNSPPSQNAQPILIQRALQAGSANIQGVSGATYTSNAFKMSLESAIALASSALNTSTAGVTTGGGSSTSSSGTSTSTSTPSGGTTSSGTTSTSTSSGSTSGTTTTSTRRTRYNDD